MFYCRLLEKAIEEEKLEGCTKEAQCKDCVWKSDDNKVGIVKLSKTETEKEEH
jgi:hypothetical protein